MSELLDLTPDHLRDGPRHKEDSARIIYMNRETRDFCRENAPAHIRDHGAAVQWARDHFRRVADSMARQHVGSFRVEWW